MPLYMGVGFCSVGIYTRVPVQVYCEVHNYALRNTPRLRKGFELFCRAMVKHGRMTHSAQGFRHDWTLKGNPGMGSGCPLMTTGGANRFVDEKGGGEVKSSLCLHIRFKYDVNKIQRSLHLFFFSFVRDMTDTMTRKKYTSEQHLTVK